MQFAFCVFKYFPHGGISRDLTKVLVEALTRGHQVRVYTLSAQAPLPDGAELVEIGVRALSNHVAYAKFAAKVAAHLAEYPVDLVMGFNKMPGLDVYYAGDSCFEEKARQQRSWYYRLTPRYQLFSRFERAVFAETQSTKILTLVPAQVAAFKRYYATPDHRFFPVPPGLDGTLKVPPADVDANRDALRRELDLPDAQRLLLFIGSGFIKKGLDRALIGLADLPAHIRAVTTLLVVGQDRATRFAKLAQRLRIAGRVRFLGGRDDVRRLLGASDALVLPAYDEAGGIVIIEAIVSGVPVLATANCGYASHVRDADAGIVLPLPFKRNKFAECLAEILTADARAGWIKNGRRYAERVDLFALPERTVDLLERFTRGEVRPVIALCTYRYTQFGGRDTVFLRIALACRDRGFHVRVFTVSWLGERPAGIEIVIVPVASIADYKRFDRFAHWVARTLQASPVHCVLGFDKMPGLDVYFANEARVEELAAGRARRYRRSPSFNLAQDAERTLAGSDVDVIYASPADADCFQLDKSGPDGEAGVVRRHVLPAFGDGKATGGATAPPGCGAAGKESTPDSRGAPSEPVGEPSDNVVLLFVSADFVKDGLDRVLFMLAKLVKLAVHGAGSCVLRVVSAGVPNAGFARMAEGLGIGERVRFEVATELTPILREADLLLHVPYFRDTNPIVADAIVSGLPVLTLAEAGHAETVRSAGAGEVLGEPFSAEQFLAAVAAALDGDTLARWRANALAVGAAGRHPMTDRVIEIIEARIERRGQALSA